MGEKKTGAVSEAPTEKSAAPQLERETRETAFGVPEKCHDKGTGWRRSVVNIEIE